MLFYGEKRMNCVLIIKSPLKKKERKQGGNECCSFLELEKIYPHEAVSTQAKNRSRWVISIVTCLLGGL